MKALWLIAACVVLMTNLAHCAEPELKGLLTNPGFDGPSPDGVPAGWSIPADARDVCQVADNEGRSGKQCLRFAIETPRKLKPVAQQFTCELDRDYVLSLWFKTVQDLRPVVCVVTPQGGMLAHVKSTGQEVWRRGAARRRMWRAETTCS